MIDRNNEFLEELFGNVEAFLKFYNSIPTKSKVIYRKSNEALDKQRMVCHYCLHKRIFEECKNFVKRTVDTCHGAFGEEVIKNMKKSNTLTDADKRTAERVLSEIATKEVAHE
jgi:hypothetical protein